MPRYFKVTGPAGECLNGGSGAWPLPSETEPGAWRTVDGPIEPCRNGLHLAAAGDLAQWIPSRHGAEYRVWLAETAGDTVTAPGKVAVRSARLLRPVDLGAYNAARATFVAAVDAAGQVQDQARAVASSRYDRVRGSHYVAMISARTLPAGHPLAAKAIAYAIVEAKARKLYDRALKRAERVYRAELAPFETALESALEAVAS